MSNYLKLKRSLEKFYSAISFSDTGTLWMAVSGGVDSVLLFRLTQELFAEEKISKLGSLGIIHVNHALRGVEADKDEELVRSLAGSVPIKQSFHRIEWGPSEKVSQETCRKKRERIYQFVLDKNDYLALAHHADDLAETIFMRVLRGTGIDSLLPMQSIQDKRLRPFLSEDKKVILDSAAEAKLSWREDGSNRSSKYERNWLRNEIFPLLERKRPGFARRLNALALEASTLSATKPHKIPKQFKYKDGITFYRITDLRELAPRDIHFLFSTNRDHSFALSEFFKKYSGRYELPNAKLCSSAGLLMKTDFAIKFDLQVRTIRESDFESLLGTWRCNDHSVQLSQYKRGVSSKFKREFIDSRVPTFFRDGIPIIKTAACESVAIPKSISSSVVIGSSIESIQFSPSDFSRQLFTALQYGFG